MRAASLPARPSTSVQSPGPAALRGWVAGRQSQRHSEGAAAQGWEGLCYLLPLEHVSEGSHLAVLVCPEDLAQRAGGHLAVQTVDVDVLLFMLLAPGLVRLLFWSGRR